MEPKDKSIFLLQIFYDGSFQNSTSGQLFFSGGEGEEEEDKQEGTDEKDKSKGRKLGEREREGESNRLKFETIGWARSVRNDKRSDLKRHQVN